MPMGFDPIIIKEEKYVKTDISSYLPIIQKIFCSFWGFRARSANEKYVTCNEIKQQALCIGNSMICSYIWHKYHE